MGLRIHSKFENRSVTRWQGGLASAASLLVFAGCHQLNNPWADSSASVDTEMTTASAEGYKGKTEFYVPLHRRGDTMQVCYENGTVTHFPLWFEDPFEDKGNDVTDPADRDAPDNHFVVNWVDYLHGVYGPGRFFFVNGVLWPISAVVTPPGTLLESDGHISQGLAGYDHDAARSNPWLREAPDQNHLSGHKNSTTPQTPESGATDVTTESTTTTETPVQD